MKRKGKGRPQRKQLDARRAVAGRKPARESKPDSTDTVMSLPAPLSKSRLALARKELTEVWQDITKEEQAFAGAVKSPKAEIKRINIEIRRSAESDGAMAGDKIAGLMEQLAAEEKHLEVLTRQHGLTISEKEARAGKLQSVIRTGMEYQPVPCRVERDYRDKTIRTRRLDNKALIEERAMTPDEMQMELAEAPGASDGEEVHIETPEGEGSSASPAEA